MTEWLTLGLAVLNFIFIWVLKPTRDERKALQQVITNQQKEIDELKKTNKALREEVRLLKELVFKITPAELLQEHLICHINENCKKEQ